MPAPTRQRVLAFLTPDQRDLFFWEHVTLSRVDHTALTGNPKWAYETAHPLTTKYPNHELVFLEHDPDLQAGPDGQDSHRYKAYYVAQRADQDKYNFEFTSADIGGQRFNAVRRTYVIKRSAFDEAAPAPGATMSREPNDKFPVGYILAGRTQQRIGQKELDALYVVETRTYVERATIRSTQTDQATGGVVLGRSDLYYRGETYTPVVGSPPVSPGPIETLAANSAAWGLTADGQNVECKQLTDNWWEVTTQDVIPQGLPDGDYGKILRTYETWQDFAWPAVVDATSLVFTLIDRKNGSSTTTVAVKPLRDAYRGPTKMTVTQFWSPDEKSLGDPYIFDTQDASYSGAQYSVGIRNTIFKSGIQLIDTIGTQDPVFEQEIYGANPWVTASDPNDWPADAAVVALTQQPFRGGFLITMTEAEPPVAGSYIYTHSVPGP